MGENNKHLVINLNQILDQNLNNINNNKYLEINNELCNIIIHNMNSINDYDINKILQLKEKSDYIIIFDSMVNALNPNNLYVNYKYNTCSIVFEYFFSQTYGSSIARTAQVQALISSGTPQLQLHPKYI